MTLKEKTGGMVLAGLLLFGIYLALYYLIPDVWAYGKEQGSKTSKLIMGEFAKQIKSNPSVLVIRNGTKVKISDTQTAFILGNDTCEEDKIFGDGKKYECIKIMPYDNEKDVVFFTEDEQKIEEKISIKRYDDGSLVALRSNQYPLSIVKQ